MKANGLKTYLESAGVNEFTSVEKVEELKTAYWKKRRVELNRMKRKEVKEVRFSLSSKDWKRLEKEADSHNLTVTEYTKQAVFSYKENVFIMPNFTHLEDLAYLVKNIATNVNTAAQFMHITRNYGDSKDGLGKMKSEVQMLLQLLRQSIEERPELFAWLEKELSNDPTKIERVESIIKRITEDASSQE